jgi:hypothetical protein
MAAALLAAAAALPAHAQACGTRQGPAPTLTAGQTVVGTLAREDYTLPGDRYDGRDPCTGRPYDSYFYEAQAGERLTFVVETRQIDPEITATTHWRGGGTKDVVEQRGRRGRTLTATGVVPATGRILIQVASNVSLGRRGSTGAYTFILRSDRPAPAPAPSPPHGGHGSRPPADGSAADGALRVGQPVRGQLTERNGQLGDGSYFQDYTYTARRGERLVAVLRSDDFDAYLHVGRRTGDGSLENTESDDDGAGDTDSRVEYTADRDGPVTIRVNTLEAGEEGAYTVVIESSSAGGGSSDGGSPGPAAGGRQEYLAGLTVLRAGQTVRGELARGDGVLNDGSFHDDYIYQARRGERLVVRMSSDDFDAVMAVSPIGEDGEVGDAQVDDDGGGGTNARVEYTATRDGRVLIRANALNEGDTGRYTLTLESSRRGAAAPSAPPSDERVARVAQARGMDAPRAAAPLFAAPASARFPSEPAARMPRMRAASGSGGWWMLVLLGAGMIWGGSEIEDTAVEPLGSLIRYTGYAVIAFAPFGS